MISKWPHWENIYSQLYELWIWTTIWENHTNFGICNLALICIPILGNCAIS
ncbi:hypothetical protein Lalb_Chr05g0214541 [Lupinus albus]|uniref:Uncharacterized protein n=1 Tax=Lupinus albus TaxID=3870 RepID=A0A6A4QIW2_LUPAL|nr:hypothetical protein Lalb_Chr05g0214541 [Lupinus albus]